MTEARAGLPKRLHDHGKKLRSLALAHIPANKFLRVNTLTWWVAVSVVIAVHLAQRITVLSGKSFYWDDFIITGHLHGMSVFSPDFIFQDHDGHFAPLAFFIQGVVYRVFGWNWLVPSIIIVALSFLLVVGVMRLLECITGRSWVSVFLLAVITWSPLMLTADTWWSAALNALPFQLGLVFFVTTVLRTTLNDDNSPKIADIILLNVTLIVALGFFEKALVIAPLAAMLLGAMAYVQRRNLKQVFDKSKNLWITSGVITVAWAAWYIFGTSHPTQDSKPSAQFELLQRFRPAIRRRCGRSMAVGTLDSGAAIRNRSRRAYRRRRHPPAAALSNTHRPRLPYLGTMGDFGVVHRRRTAGDCGVPLELEHLRNAGTHPSLLR